MSSMLGTPFQISNTMVEMSFILDHRLRAQAASRQSLKPLCDEIFDSVVKNFMSCEASENLLSPKRLYPLSNLFELFRSVFLHPALRLSDESFGKLFNMAIMSVKLQVLQCKQTAEISLVTERKLRALRDMTRSVALQDDVNRMIGCLSEFYGSLNTGEASRMRMSLLNFFRRCHYPVRVLIVDGFQSENGHLIVPTNGLNAQNLGVASLYNEDGAITDDYVLPIAGKGVEKSTPYHGENLYSAQKVGAREQNRSAGMEDHVSAHSNFYEKQQMDALQSLKSSRYNYSSDALSEYSRPSVYEPSSDNESVSSSASYALRLEASRNATASTPTTPDADFNVTMFSSNT